jgi:hypothetical protein
MAQTVLRLFAEMVAIFLWGRFPPGSTPSQEKADRNEQERNPQDDSETDEEHHFQDPFLAVWRSFRE